jgi:hypothetical protein
MFLPGSFTFLSGRYEYRNLFEIKERARNIGCFWYLKLDFLLRLRKQTWQRGLKESAQEVD